MANNVMNIYTGTAAALALSVLILVLAQRLRRTQQHSKRAKLVPPTTERVLVLGASSGVGRALVKRYASRGARVCAVARRAAQLASLAAELGDASSSLLVCETADFTAVEDMVRVRAVLEKRWGGLDTVLIVAGVSSLQPVMMLAGVEGDGEKEEGGAKEEAGRDADGEGIRAAVEIAGRAVQANFFGPYVSAVTFIPMLKRTSASPAILLVSSVAAIIPAPTRALYAATKASSLLLFQSLAIEQPAIAFTHLLPATIAGDFRAGAVDAHIGGVREADPNKKGLKIEVVARRSVEAIDRGVTGNVVLPWFPYAVGQLVYGVWPSLIEAQARRKYNFQVSGR